MDNELCHREAQLAEAERELVSIGVQLETLRQRHHTSELRVQALRQIVSGLRGLRSLEQGEMEGQEALAVDPPPLLPDVHPTTQDEPRVEVDTPRGQDAIRRVMRGSGRAWTVPDLFATMRELGWVNTDARDPRGAVSVAVNRLREKGEVERTGLGQYVYVEDELRRDSAPIEAAHAADESEAHEQGGNFAAA